MEPELEDVYLWELNFSVVGPNKFDVNDAADDESKWYINENFDFALLVCVYFWFYPFGR